MPGAYLQVEDGASLTLERDCRIVVHGDARVTTKAKVGRKLKKKGQLINAQ